MRDLQAALDFAASALEKLNDDSLPAAWTAGFTRRLERLHPKLARAGASSPSSLFH
jgi:hypothetical protein